MSEVIKNRYEFVVLFDVETEIQMEILMQGICQELIRIVVWVLLRMFVLAKNP